MIPPKADFSARDVPAPPQRWCSSGHFAPELFRREGAGTPEAPTKFYSVTSSSDPSIRGTYCEPCLIVANYLARKQKGL